MGLWDWIYATLTSERTDARPERGRHDVEQTANVAVLDESDEAPTSTKHPWWAPPDCGRTEPAPVTRPEMSDELRSLENLLETYLEGRDMAMPALPQVPEQVLQYLGTADVNLNVVAEMIAEDQVVAAAVLRTVNSPYYRPVTPIASLGPAVRRLGIRAIRTLMMHQSVRAMSHNGKVDKHLATAVWCRSLAGGAIMRELATLTGINEEDAFLFGLLHNIGDVIVLREVHQQQAALGHAINLPQFDYLCDQFHQHFGHEVARAWNLSSELSEIISDHHDWPAGDDAMQTARIQLILTDMITDQLGYGHDQQYDLLNTQAAVALGLGKDPTSIELLTSLPDRVEDAMTWL